MRVCQRLGDDLQHGIGLAQHLVVPETQHAPALRLQELRALLVMRQSVAMRVLATVELDDQAGCHAGEVREVGADGMLAAEFVLAQLLGAQVAPE